jgi:hypothetical protein
MANEFFNASGVPGFHSPGASADIRTEVLAIQTGFDKLPVMSGNANKVLVINPTGTAIIADPDSIVRQTDLSSGSNITIVASGNITPPNPGNYFTLLSSGVFDVTGFANIYNGWIGTFKFPAGLSNTIRTTLVHSANLRLQGGVNRTAAPNEIIRFVNESPGIYVELPSVFPTLDLTGYSGADVALGIGQSAIYTVTAVSSLLLRIATGDNQIFSLDISPALSNANVGGVLLQPNNVSVTSIFYSQGNFTVGVGWSASFSAPSTVFSLSINACALHSLMCRIINRTINKAVYSDYMSSSSTANTSGFFKNEWADTTTVWSSLGTLVFNQTLTGLIRVRREM